MVINVARYAPTVAWESLMCFIANGEVHTAGNQKARLLMGMVVARQGGMPFEPKLCEQGLLAKNQRFLSYAGRDIMIVPIIPPLKHDKLLIFFLIDTNSHKYIPILYCPFGGSALSFQEKADPPSENCSQWHYEIGTYF
jgi:hypothetical protein